MEQLQLLMQHAQLGSVLSQKLDRPLSAHGLSFTEFMVLHHLQQAPGGSLSRIALAEKVALTASGITRLLAPMEKTGWVKKQKNPKDARQSLVAITPAAQTVLADATTTAQQTATDICSLLSAQELTTLATLLNKLKC